MTNHPDHIARRHVEHDLATETFGPLHMYGIHEPVAVGVISDSRKAYNDNLPDAPHRSPAYLATLRDAPGFTYLGSPYSLYKAGHNEAARIVATAAASIMAKGLRVYSPIAHGHFVSQHGKLLQTWDFWKAQCQPMIDAASSLIVLRMDGWTESVGLNYEIDEFTRARKPVLYLHPSEFGAADREEGCGVSERYFMSMDSSGHGYVIPVAKQHEWEEWADIPGDDERAWDAPEFARPVGGSLACVTFSEPVVP